jgi:predicted XRE-type DNA-binding protein
MGSGNIFADLGLPNAEEHQLKAALTVQLERLIAERALTQSAAAKILGIERTPTVAALRNAFAGHRIALTPPRKTRSS